MRIKRKIPSFVFGLSIGLIVGIGFFIFKLDDFLKKINKPTIQNIKVTEQVIKQADKNQNTSQSKKETKKTIKTNQSPNINYSEVDALISDENITVAKEELLVVKNIKVIDLDSKQVKKDTLTGQLAGVTSNENANLFFVEFWKTPLNSKGYRMTRNRVILYGILDYSNIMIYKVDDNYYLKNQDIVYKISSGTEFKAMEIIHDTDLLAKLN